MEKLHCAVNNRKAYRYKSINAAGYDTVYNQLLKHICKLLLLIRNKKSNCANKQLPVLTKEFLFAISIILTTSILHHRKGKDRELRKALLSISKILRIYGPSLSHFINRYCQIFPGFTKLTMNN